MRFSQTLREINRNDLLIVKPRFGKPVTVLVWMFLWAFFYFAFLKDVVMMSPKVFHRGEPSYILAVLAIFGLVILFVYWTASSIYYNVIKDRDVRVTLDESTLAVKIGRHIHYVHNKDIEEIRLKKIVDSNGRHSFNLSVVSKEKHLLLLIKSGDEICYELADRLNKMTNAEIKIS
jgi:hypothetical protein